MDASYQIRNNKQMNTVSAIAFIAVILFPFMPYLTQDPVFFAVSFGLSAVAYAWLFTHNGALIPAVSALATWCISLFVTRSAFSSLVMIIPVVYGISLSFVKKEKLSRSTAIATSSGIITVGFTACLLAITFINTGRITLNSITEAFPQAFSVIKEVLYTSFEVTIADTTVPLITPIDVQKYLNLIIAVAPGAIYAVFSSVGFVVAWLYSSLLKTFADEMPAKNLWRLTISPITTLFFVIALIVFTASGTFNIISLTAANLVFIFVITFFIAGLSSAFEPIVKDGFIRPRLLRPFILIIAFINDISVFITISLVFAIFDSIRSAIPKPNPDNN